MWHETVRASKNVFVGGQRKETISYLALVWRYLAPVNLTNPFFFNQTNDTNSLVPVRWNKVKVKHQRTFLNSRYDFWRTGRLSSKKLYSFEYFLFQTNSFDVEFLIFFFRKNSGDVYIPAHYVKALFSMMDFWDLTEIYNFWRHRNHLAVFIWWFNNRHLSAVLNISNLCLLNFTMLQPYMRLMYLQDDLPTMTIYRLLHCQTV